MTPRSAISVSNLSYVYQDGTRALDGLSLEILEGEKVAILGPNGAGKSTLLLHLNGIHHGNGHDPVRIFGIPVTHASVRDVRRRVGVVFQNPDDQLFCPTIYEDIAFGPRNLGLPEDEVARRVANSLAAVGLEGVEAKSAYHLSIGQRKRAALATVLALDAEILVLDEPTAGLDPRGRREAIALLRDIGRTQVIATHDLDLARALCDRALVLDRGKVVAAGAPDALLEDVSLLDRYGLA